MISEIQYKKLIQKKSATMKEIRQMEEYTKFIRAEAIKQQQKLKKMKLANLNLGSNYKIINNFKDTDYEVKLDVKVNPENLTDDNLKTTITTLLENFFNKMDVPSAKVKLVREYYLFDVNNNQKDVDYYISSENIVIGKRNGNVETKYDEEYEKLLQGLEHSSVTGSGNKLGAIKSLYVFFHKFTPLQAGSYLPTPTVFSNKKCLINIKNTDNKCFLYCLAAHAYKNEPNRYRMKKIYKNFSKTLNTIYNGQELEFPMKVQDIYKFEKINPKYHINVFSANSNGVVFPVRISQNGIKQKEINSEEQKELEAKQDQIEQERLENDEIEFNNSDSTCEKPFIYNEFNDPIQYDDSEESETEPIINENEVVNLLLINGEINSQNDECSTNHYILITNLEQLIYNKTAGRKYVCNKCIQFFNQERFYLDHQRYCNFGTQRITYLKFHEDKFLKYQNRLRNIFVDFIIYADFECINVKVPNSTDREHVCCSYGFRVVNRTLLKHQKNKFGYYTETGPGAEHKFLVQLFYIYNTIKNYYQPWEKPKQLAKKKCDFCNLVKDNVGNLFHRVNKSFIGEVCMDCQCEYNCTKKIHIPVVFHNLQGYDGHIIIKALANFKEKTDYENNLIEHISVVPINMEKYISFSLFNYYPLRFIDSYQFLKCPLATLVESLAEKDLQIKEHNNNVKTPIAKILCKKLPYCYDYMNSFDKFDDTELPSKEMFFNKLDNKGISDKDYKLAQKVWKVTNCKNLLDFSNVYLKADVDLLTCVFEKFRETSMENYGLDPAHYFTAPGFAWDAMLKKTDIKLELFTENNKEMSLFLENGIRGGLSMVPNRKAEANNKFCPNYDPEKPTTWISYLDANNLYGWSMSQPLPIGNFKWEYRSNFNQCLKNSRQREQELVDNVYRDGDKILNEIELNKMKELYKNLKNLVVTTEEEIQGKANAFNAIEKTFEKFGRGYIYEVDLEYPEHLHNLHNDYPLAPQRENIFYKDLSNYNKLQEKESYSSTKLCTTLKNKKNYIVYYRTLHLYEALGMVITKVHKVLSFDERAWMKGYIDFNTNKRSKTKNKFEKDFYKLMNNSPYGKTLENLRNRSNVKMVYTEKQRNKFVHNACFKRMFMVNKSSDLAIVDLACNHVKMVKPLYCGFTILDLSKYFMYKFHYVTVKNQFNEKAKLLMTDTDSLCYLIEHEDIYKWYESQKEAFDLSDFPKDHYLHSDDNKKVIGKMKDEFCNHTEKKLSFVDKVTKEPIAKVAKDFNYCYNNDGDLRIICDKETKKVLNGKNLLVRSNGKTVNPNEVELKEHDYVSNCYVTKFVGLGAKSYALEKVTDNFVSLNDKITAKGVPNVCRKQMTCDEYDECLKTANKVKASYNRIVSERHNLKTISLDKVKLSVFDDKRFILKNGIDTMAYGHYRIK